MSQRYFCPAEHTTKTKPRTNPQTLPPPSLSLLSLSLSPLSLSLSPPPSPSSLSLSPSLPPSLPPSPLLSLCTTKTHHPCHRVFSRHEMVSPGCSTIRSQIRKYSSSVVTDFKFASLKEFTVETQQTTSTIHQTQRYFNGTSNTTNYINCTSNTTVHQTQQTTSTVHQTQLTRIHGPAPSDRTSAFQLQRHFPKNQNGQRSVYCVYL